MKKILYLLIGLFLFIPFNIKALAEAQATLTCEGKVKQNSNVDCTVKLTVTTGTIKSFEASLTGDGTYFSSTSNAFQENSSISDVFEKKVQVLALEKAGTGKITLKDIKVMDDENNEVTISEVSTTVKVLDNNSFLTNIKLDDKNIDTYGVTFAPNTTNYTINITKKSSINISVEKSSTVSVAGIGTKNLTCGVNNIDITATSEDKTKTTTYKLVINRTCDSDTTLKNIVISSGKLNPSYVASTRSYNVDVTKDIDKITINAVKNNEAQKVTGVVKDYALKFGENKFTITVVAENGNSKDYVITVNRQDTRSTNNNLKSLEIEEGKLNKEFKSDVLEYQMKVLYDVTKLNIKYETEEEHAKVEVLGDVNKLKENENIITLKVTSEKGDVKEYKLVVTRLKEGETLGNNPDISELNIKGYDINFSKDKQVYSLKIEKEKTLNIEVILEDPTSSYKITGNNDLKDGSIIKINTTSKDGSTREYQIVIEKENKNENGRYNTQNFAGIVKTVFKKVRQRNGIVGDFGVNTQALRNKTPVQPCAERKPDSNPESAYACNISITRQAHQHPAAHIRGFRAHCRNPRADFTTAEHIALHIACILHMVKPDGKQHNKIKCIGQNTA